MLKNYFKVALRNLKKHKTYSIVNIFGLAVGMSAFILIALLMNYEYSWDKFHKDADKIYRVQALVELKNGTQEWTQTSFPIAQELRNNYPEFEKVTVLREVHSELVSKDNEMVLPEREGYYIEPDFFNIFDVKFIKGNKNTALQNENSVIITDEFANRVFGDEDPMGKTLISNVNGNLIVSAVVGRWPEESHFRPNYMVNFSRLKASHPSYNFTSNWDSWGFRTYVKLKDKVSFDNVNAKIRDILDDKLDENYKKLYLRPLLDLHLGGRMEDAYNSPLPFYAAIAWFVLLLACINFINLTTAKSAQREKEIGIRKVIGSNRFSLFIQFIGESMIVTFLSLLLAFFIAELLLPPFNSIMQRNLSIDYLGDFGFVAFMIGVMMLVGFISTIYPALYLSSFSPMSVLKGFTSFSKSFGSKGKIRKILVGFQFVISITLIIQTYYIFNQVDYMKNKDIGFTKDNLIRIAIPNNDNQNSFEDLRNRLMANKNVIDVCKDQHSPMFGSSGRDVNYEGGRSEEKINSRYNSVSASFIDTYNMKILQGRNFSLDNKPSDNYAIVNESFVKKVGWTNPVGKTIDDGKFTVIGVVKDFHYSSVHNLIEPYLMTLQNDNINNAFDLIININPNNKAVTVDEISNLLKEYFPHSLYQIMHYGEKLDLTILVIWEGVKATFGYFAFITIVIAMIGIIALLSFAVEKKTKEIGIRKVLGATINGLYLLINKDFFKIFIITIIPAILISISAITITPGAYKYQMSWFDYALPVITVFVLSLFATAFISLKAASDNPVNSLRDK